MNSSDPSELFDQLSTAKLIREADAHAALVALPGLLSGEAVWLAFKQAIEEIERLAPKDHDIFIRVGDIRVVKARFIYPHSFFFEGLDQDGNHTRVIIHFSQLNARVVYFPKRGAKRVISILDGAA